MAFCTTYNVCFFTYIWLMPVFMQFLIRAPSNFDSAPFYPVSVRTLSGDVPELYMSSFPQTTRSGVNHCRPCQEIGGQRSGMYQWDVMLSMPEKDLIRESRDKPVSTMYPLVFASNDAKIWKVVADADDVAGKGHWAGKSNDADEATHLSAPLLVATLKNFGCPDDGETLDTDPYFHHFSSKSKALQYKWNLAKHIAMHDSVNIVACIMQGMDNMNQLIHTYARDCLYQGEMKCHYTAQQALGKCFAIGSACGQACGIISPNSPECMDGSVDPRIFQGLTHRRVKIKTSPGGGGAAEALKYCSKPPCLRFMDMYVEAENPIEFLKAQMDARNNEKGSYYTVMFAMSDFHPPVHTYEVISDDEDEDEDEDEGASGGHHLKHRHHKIGKGKDDEDEGDSDEGKGSKKHHDKEAEEKEKPKKKSRTCVDLPGVRLGEIDKTGLLSQINKKGTNTPLTCTAACGKRPACQQSIFSQENKGCYLFKISTVEVKDFSSAFNSSYCGDTDTKPIMMTMLHQAYKSYVPPTPAPKVAVAPPLRRLSDAPERFLQASPAKKYYWQIAHVPNGTKGVLMDQGANEVRVIPRNTSCFTTPGFVYMVACMTAKPVYFPDRTQPLRPPPFNDRCLAVGGLCGATCGSGQKATENVAKYCPLGVGAAAARRLQGASPYASAPIPKSMLVQRIDPLKNSTGRSYASRAFFNTFVVILIVSYITTILRKFPGNFHDVYPRHTWDEIHTHGYVLEKFGSAVTCSTSTSENKTVVFRNWLGKITTRPQFDDNAFPTFAKWVDVFCDEGHREGARVLWMAWTEFLNTSPPMQFLEEWASALRDLTPEQSVKCSPFDLVQGKKKLLPVMPAQASAFGNNAPEGGTNLQQDSLAKLRDLHQVFKSLPADLSMPAALPRTDDVVLTGRLMMELQGAGKGSSSYTVRYSSGWQKEAAKKVEERMAGLSLPSKDRDRYEKTLTVTDKNGQRVSAFGAGASTLKEDQFPLLFREPPARKDRQVIMIYCARAKPEIERKGIDKTRGLDKYLWASLRPNAVCKAGTGAARGSFGTRRKQSAEEERPLLTAEEDSERSWSSVSGTDPFILEEVKRCVEGMVEKQHDLLLDAAGEDPEKPDAPPGAGSGSALVRRLTKTYLKCRTVDSDWEMARFCYGEVMGEEKDADGHEIVILDNPSPALLELVSDLPDSAAGPDGKPPMGLVALDGGEDGKSRTARPVRPSLQFHLLSTKPNSSNSASLQKEFRRKLQQALGDPTLDLKALKIQEQSQGTDLIIDVTGPGKLIELIRARNIRDIEVLNFRGRMLDTHPSVAVKKELLMPYAGVRGRSGGLNFVVDLLQYRQGFIGSAAEGDPTPERMLLGVFDAQHQPHQDFWKRCLPKFMRNVDGGYTYTVNDDIALVQAPENAGKSDMDSFTGVSLSVLNMIRNRCGGVTSCGTNAVWQVNAKDFSRSEDDSVFNEYFHTRTLIHDTASTHSQFCKGKRSVYVQEKVATGMHKSNSECLALMQMRAEGSVQLFWVELFSDKTRQLWKLALCLLAFVGFLYLHLYGPTLKGLIGYNLFCDADGPTLLLGTSHPLCTTCRDFFGSSVLSRNIDKVQFQMAEHDYMQIIEMGLWWLLISTCMGVVTTVLAARGIMPSIVRVFVMMENIVYWMTSCNIFFWLMMTLFLVLGMEPPLMCHSSHFMFFVLLLNITQHCLLSEYKSISDCTELSVWRSQQAHTLAAPLYVQAFVQGTIGAWHGIWGGHDKSVWTSSTTQEVVRDVTVWVTLIWVAFVACAGAIMAFEAVQLVFDDNTGTLRRDEHFGALFLIGLIAATVWEPFLSLWGMDQALEMMSSNQKSGKMKQRLAASFIIWWRSKAWLLRYVIDFVIPFLVMAGILNGGHSLITLVAYANTMHGLRM